jgi:hypothetical protein
MFGNINIATIILTITGLCLFEIVSSIDNAVINAEVLSTMSKKSRKWFLFWGLLFAVIVVRGLLPWVIVWATNSSLGPIGALTATFSNDPSVKEAIDSSAPILLAGGGTFLIFLFFHWLFIEPKSYGLRGERFFHSQGIWFFAIASIFLAIIVWSALKINPMMAFGAVIGSTAFFITHGFKQNAEQQEKQLTSGKNKLSDMSKILYLKNGAMYSILFLGLIMILDSFGFEIPSWVSPVATFLIIGYFFFLSKRELELIKS